MKKFEMLGRTLSKDQMKRITGGNEPPAGCDCGCKNDLECGTMVCSKTTSASDCGKSGQSCSIHECVPK